MLTTDRTPTGRKIPLTAILGGLFLTLLVGSPVIAAVTDYVGGDLQVRGTSHLFKALTVDGASPIVLEGATNDAYELTVAVTDPTADITMTLPNNAGNVTVLANGESLNTTTDATFKFVRNTAGAVTLTCADDDATCALVLDPGGAAGLTLGSGDVTALTVTTDSTGTAEVALPAGSIDGTELLDGTVTLPDLARAAHATFTICGDATTVNNNTVYYGPSAVVLAGYGRTCDITQVGNATEATADEVVSGFPGITSAHVTSMVCLLNDPGATVSLTLRSGAAATTPSVTCSIADNATGCVADVQTTTVVDLTATAAIAAASTADMGTAQFHCTVDVVF